MHATKARERLESAGIPTVEFRKFTGKSGLVRDMDLIQWKYWVYERVDV